MKLSEFGASSYLLIKSNEEMRGSDDVFMESILGESDDLSTSSFTQITAQGEQAIEINLLFIEFQ